MKSAEGVISSERMGQPSNRSINVWMKLDLHSLILAILDPLHAVKMSPLTGIRTSIVNM